MCFSLLYRSNQDTANGNVEKKGTYFTGHGSLVVTEPVSISLLQNCTSHSSLRPGTWTFIAVISVLLFENSFPDILINHSFKTSVPEWLPHTLYLLSCHKTGVTIRLWRFDHFFSCFYLCSASHSISETTSYHLHLQHILAGTVGFALMFQTL